jgi:Activator of Hsp90 ATPase homolog 1-like protein
VSTASSARHQRERAQPGVDELGGAVHVGGHLLVQQGGGGRVVDVPAQAAGLYVPQAGQGGRPEGFKPEAGTRFRFTGRPFPGWDGIVRCQVLAVHEPTLLSYDWRNKETDQPTVVTNILQEIPGGTRLTWEHTGFRGLGGMFMSRLLGRVRRKMLDQGLPPVLADIGDDGRLQPGRP